MTRVLSQAMAGAAFPQFCWALQATSTPSPEPSPTIIQAPAAGPLEIVGAVLAIAFALAAGILGYRIIRGGRGL
jgi:hypothetical protein